MCWNIQEEEEMDFRPSTIAEWDRYDTELAAFNAGGKLDQQWLISSYDVVYRNPYYSGPEQRHPHDDYYDDEEPLTAEEHAALFARKNATVPWECPNNCPEGKCDCPPF